MISHKILKDFGVLALSASRRSQTAQQAPKSAPRPPGGSPGNPITPQERPKRGPTGGTRTDLSTSLALEGPRRFPEAILRLPRRPARSSISPQEGPTGPEGTPWEAPRGPPRHPAKSCSQKAFPEHVFPQSPREIMFPESLPGTWFSSFHKRLPKRALATGPEGTPWEAPRGPPRHPAKSRPQKIPKGLPGTWFTYFRKRLPKRALGAQGRA